ncbi:MAG: trehalose-6-phosphate synthase [Actinomycetota bacterium]
MTLDATAAPPASEGTSHDLVVVANRLPIRRIIDGDDVRWTTSPGGLVSALAPSLADFDQITWVGWTGDQQQGDGPPPATDGIRLAVVPVSEEEKELHYDGMSNGTLWPLYHDKVAPVEFHRSWYEGYRKVNERFAETTAAAAAPGATVWVHDYQLQLVPAMLRARRPDLRIGYFLHIPFPAEELFSQLPWRTDLAGGILGSDLVGFQTPDAVDNFIRLAVRFGLASRDGRSALICDGRRILVKSFPIGIDNDRYEEAAQQYAVADAARDLRARLGQPHVVLLGVDRLDYTKGIDVRLRAFKELLADGRLHASQVSMVQVAEPSRDDVDAYISLRARVEQLVGEINGDFGRVGFPVVHYIHQTQNFEQLLSLYRAADVMLVTPFRDGMNLVAKEYVACHYDDTGVLVLSEFAGAAHQLKNAVLVNPHDIVGVKNAIMQAIEMDPEEKRVRMRAMRRAVKRTDASSWAKSFLVEMPVSQHS